MKFLKSIHLQFLFGALLLAALACQSTTPTNTPGDTPSLVPATSGPGGSSSANAPVNFPAKRADQAGDPDSSTTASKKIAAGGETFAQNLYERPFKANTMDYLPYVDIVDFQGFKDDTWGYATIKLSNVDANGHLPAKYGVELDLNKDGRGNWLILASNPSSTTWTTQGVQAWKDSNGDVGGTVPIFADKKVSTGDGYETLIFDQGKGDNTDGAWVKISSDDPKTVLIAFKLSMLGSPASYAMGGWAGTDALNPAMFDLNDHMTHEQAGSPLRELNFYPLKALAEIDNTCRLAIAFTPTGKEPGLCKTIQPVIQQVPTVKPFIPPVLNVCLNYCTYGFWKGYPDCICNIG